MTDQKPEQPKPQTFVDAFRLIFQFLNWVTPESPKWRNITYALWALYAAAILPLYTIGESNLAVRRIVTWVWMSTIFGLLSGTSPYYDMDNSSFYSPRYLEDSGYYDFSLLAAICLIIGGLISVRIITFALELFERGTGINVIVGAVQRWIVGKTKGDDDTPKHNEPSAPQPPRPPAQE